MIYLLDTNACIVYLNVRNMNLRAFGENFRRVETRHYE